MERRRLPDAIRRRQDACGATFIALFATNFVFQLLIVIGVISGGFGVYAFILATMAVLGYLQLMMLSSNTVSDIFAASLFGIELFFSLMRPFLVSLDIVDKEVNEALMIFGAAFNFIALYLWGVFFSSCRIDRRNLWWMLALPLPYIVNIIGYIGYVTIFADQTSLASGLVESPMTEIGLTPALRMVLSLFMPVGYWKLAHLPYFSKHAIKVDDRMRLSPFNLYTLVYLAIALLAIFPFISVAKWISNVF